MFKVELRIKKGSKNVLSASYTKSSVKGKKGNFNLGIDYDHEEKMKQVNNAIVDDKYSFQFNFS